jgi:hypothetical protein
MLFPFQMGRPVEEASTPRGCLLAEDLCSLDESRNSPPYGLASELLQLSSRYLSYFIFKYLQTWPKGMARRIDHSGMAPTIRRSDDLCRPDAPFMSPGQW